MLDEAKPSAGDWAMPADHIWAMWSWGFATAGTNPGALVPYLLLLLPFLPPVGSGARWAHFPYLLGFPSVSLRCPTPTPLGPMFACCWGQAQLSTFCAQGKPGLGAQDLLQPSSSCCGSSSSICSLCISSPQADHLWGLPPALLESSQEMQKLFGGNDCERIDSTVEVCVCRNPR